MPDVFAIDGKDYPIPDPDGLTMGEAMALEGYGVQLAELGPGSSLTVGVLAGLMHVAVTRKTLGITAAEARAIVERQNLVAALEAFADEGDDAGLPLEMTPPADATSSSTPTTGKDSENGSDAFPVGHPRRTGYPRSGTPPASDPATSST